MANSWGESGTTWGQGNWGQQNVTTVVLSGLSITSSLGEVLSYPEQGWGSDTWGTENWGESGLTIPVTGYSMTASLGTLAHAAALDGWGREVDRLMRLGEVRASSWRTYLCFVKKIQLYHLHLTF